MKTSMMTITKTRMGAYLQAGLQKGLQAMRPAAPLLIGGLLTLCAGRTQAQMSVGRIVEYAVEKKVTVDAPLNKVWDSLSNPETIPKYAGAIISAVTREGTSNIYDFMMRDGSVIKGRKDYLEPRSENRFCTITLQNPLPDSIQTIEWLLTVKYAPDGKGVVVRWAAVIEGGRQEAKDLVKSQATEMFEVYLKRLADFFPVRPS